MTRTAALDPEQQDPQHAPQLAVIPYRYCKVVHLVRHGQGFHNIAGEADNAQYQSWEFEDAHLTDLGWRQGMALRAHARAAGVRPDLVVVSPLTRALETAVAAFGGELVPQGGGGCADGALLMRAQSEEAGKRSAHPGVAAAGAPKFVALELAREQLGRNPCDRRRPLSHYRQNFPAVDFSAVADEEDLLWTPAAREPVAALQARGSALLQWLVARPEGCIAVVSHSGLLRRMLEQFGPGAGGAVRRELGEHFANAEMRTVVVADVTTPTQPPDRLHFPGGTLV